MQAHNQSGKSWREAFVADDSKTTPDSSDTWDATQWYVVQSGDSLSKIAKNFYGDASLFPRIFDANRDTLNNPDMIRVGQKLRIP